MRVVVHDFNDEEIDVGVSAGNYRPQSFEAFDSDTSISSVATPLSAQDQAAAVFTFPRAHSQHAGRSLRYPVTKLQFCLLLKKEVLDLIHQHARITLKPDRHAADGDYAVLVHPAVVTRDRVRRLLETEIGEESFPVRDGDREDHALAESLNDSRLQTLTVKSLEGGQLRIAYHKSVKRELDKFLWKRKNPFIHIPLPFPPGDVARFLEQHMVRFTKTLRISVQHSEADFHNVTLSLEGWPGDEPSLKVVIQNCTDRTLGQLVFNRAAELVSCIKQKDVPVSLEVGLYLQTVRGQGQLLNDVGDGHHCVVGVSTPAERVLLSAVLCGHQLEICQGNIAVIDTQISVVPLCENQTEWSDFYKHILASGK
jgi:hypothetical protein